jgi:hypothetical protein
MRSAPVLSLCLTTALACSGSGGAPSTGRPIPTTDRPIPTTDRPFPMIEGPRSFLVHGKLTVKASSGREPSGPLADSHDFTMHIDPKSRTLVIGAGESAAGSPISLSDRATFQTTGLLDLALGQRFSCWGERVRYSQLSATVQGDRVAGTARGKMSATNGHVAWDDLDVTLDFSGTPDDVGPSFGEDLMNVYPLSGLFIPASEPLPAGTTARLVGSAPEVTLEAESRESTGGAVTGFRKRDDTALAFGASYELVVSPGSDLAGNAATTWPVIATNKLPPLLAADNLGFEDPATTTVAGIAVVDATFLPPITGQRSLFLAPSGAGSFVGSKPPVPWAGRMVVRLAVPLGATRLKLQARPVSPHRFGLGDRVEIMVGAPGGAITRAERIDWNSPLVRHPVAGLTAGELFLGDARTVELPLPAGHGSEVVVDVWAGRIPDCSQAGGSNGLLLDDLRVE